MDKLLDPNMWLFLGIVAIIANFAHEKFKIPLQLNCCNVIKKYLDTFPRKSDVVFYVVIPMLFAMASTLGRPINEKVATAIFAVSGILCIPVFAAVYIAHKASDIVNVKTVRNLSDRDVLIRCQDCISTAVFEILMLCVLETTLFMAYVFVGVTQYRLCVDYICYFVFYIYILNMFNVVRRIAKIC